MAATRALRFRGVGLGLAGVSRRECWTSCEDRLQVLTWVAGACEPCRPGRHVSPSYNIQNMLALANAQAADISLEKIRDERKREGGRRRRVRRRSCGWSRSEKLQGRGEQVERGSREPCAEAPRGEERVRAHAGGHLPASGARMRALGKESDDQARGERRHVIRHTVVPELSCADRDGIAERGDVEENRQEGARREAVRRRCSVLSRERIVRSVTTYISGTGRQERSQLLAQSIELGDRRLAAFGNAYVCGNVARAWGRN
eukprot:2264821-Pleurochrysis_carterae.AAC.8